MSTSIRQMLQALTLAVALALLAGSALARPEIGADRYIPSADEVNRTLAPLGYTAEPVDIDVEPWDAGAYFRVSGGPSPIYDLLLVASVLPTVEEADELFRADARLLASGTESTHARTPHPDETADADDARDLRFIFTGSTTGRRISTYMRLVRIGEVVILVEATGSPEADDHGAVDNDRSLAVVRLTDLILAKVREAPRGRGETP